MEVDSYQAAFLLIGLGSILSVAGLLVVRRVADLKTLKQCHEVGGYLYSVVGTLYAVLLGLVVVDAMAKFELARTTVEQEANSLADVFILVDSFPEAKKKAVQGLCTQYADRVINEEWSLMDKGQVSIPARKTAIALMREITSFNPVTEQEKALYPIAVSEACQVWDNRRARTNFSSYGIPTVEWIALILGGIVTVIFTYFFGLENLKAQIVMTAMCSLLIALNLYLMLLFGYPFSGDLKVPPDAFQVDEALFEHEYDYRHRS